MGPILCGRFCFWYSVSFIVEVDTKTFFWLPTSHPSFPYCYCLSQIDPIVTSVPDHSHCYVCDLSQIDPTVTACPRSIPSLPLVPDWSRHYRLSRIDPVVTSCPGFIPSLPLVLDWSRCYRVSWIYTIITSSCPGSIPSLPLVVDWSHCYLLFRIDPIVTACPGLIPLSLPLLDRKILWMEKT